MTITDPSWMIFFAKYIKVPRSLRKGTNFCTSSSFKSHLSHHLMKFWTQLEFCIGSSPELSAFAASCRFRKVAWILVLQIPALLVQNKTHMVNMDEAPNFHKMLKPELKLNTCEAMVQKLLARKLLLFRCSMMASLVLFSLF